MVIQCTDVSVCQHVVGAAGGMLRSHGLAGIKLMLMSGLGRVASELTRTTDMLGVAVNHVVQLYHVHTQMMVTELQYWFGENITLLNN